MATRLEAGPPVDFKSFILSAQRAREDDILIFQEGRVTTIGERFQFNQSRDEIIEDTWRVFQGSLEQSFTKERLSFIFARSGLNIDELSRQGLPLRARYVEDVGIGASVVTTQCLWELYQGEKPLMEELSVEELRRLEAQAREFQYLGRVDVPEKITGGPRANDEYFATPFHNIDQRRARLFDGSSTLTTSDPNIPRDHPYLQRLGMGIISLLETNPDCPDKDIIIPAPSAGEGEVDYYRVHDVVSLGGLNAFALIPVSESSSLQPLVVFRCTKQAFSQHEMLESIRNDAELRMGESGYLASKAALDAMMEDPALCKGKQPLVISYSLGGSHATYFFRDHWKKLAGFVGFNICGASAEVVESIAKQINQLPEQMVPPSIYVHRIEKENVNYVGGKHIGWGIRHPNALVQVMEWDAFDHEKPDVDNLVAGTEIFKWGNLHCLRSMDSLQKYPYTIYRGRACDPILDSYKRNRKYEDVRRKWGVNLLYHFVNVFSLLFDFALRIWNLCSPPEKIESLGRAPSR